MILASSFFIFCLVGPLTFWLGERSSRASLSCPPQQLQADSPVVWSPSQHPQQ
ncbi:hypothetical protein [Acaryochloris sp. IP29b_bin.137]|uniref:hypothetical protein n=1 Tax=Acaryochloris sp. IP29b_bin.137 TaxID=2969217 RepID=UPI002639870A|nr:hypothetical protein [Acaryochloris sp. IP29b_bin.137]